MAAARGAPPPATRRGDAWPDASGVSCACHVWTSISPVVDCWGELSSTSDEATRQASSLVVNEARSARMISEVYAWCTEGFDTADLQAAKALLEELASRSIRLPLGLDQLTPALCIQPSLDG